MQLSLKRQLSGWCYMGIIVCVLVAWDSHLQIKLAVLYTLQDLLYHLTINSANSFEGDDGSSVSHFQSLSWL